MRFISAPVSSRPRTVEPGSWPMARPISSSVRPCSATWSSSSRQIFEHVVDLAGPAARVDAEQAAVGEARGVRVHGVGQAALLADLLEEPGGHAAAEGGVEHAEGAAALVGAGEAGHAEDEVGLLGLAVEQLDAAGGAEARRPRAGRSARRRCPRRAPAVLEGRADLAYDLVVVDVAGGGDHQVRRGRSAAVEAADAVAR